MKMIKIAFSLFLSFAFLSNLHAQTDLSNRFSAGAGYGVFVPGGDIEADKIITSNGASAGSGSIGYNAEGINFFVNYEKIISPKFSIGAAVNYMQKEGVFNDDRKTILSSPSGTINIDHRSNAELKVLRNDFLAYYNLLPNRQVDFKIGLGPSLVYREHFYRDYVEFDATDDITAVIVDESFTTSKEAAVGVTGQARIDVPINDQFSVGLNATHTLYFNSDYGSSIGASIGYSF